VRELFEKGKFAEVWVKTPIEVCTDRDPKGLYKKAADGSLPNLSGVGQEYEPPTHAELILDGTEDIAVNVAKIMDELL
jgi:bifunctional enzyme CysN/CysC